MALWDFGLVLMEDVIRVALMEIRAYMPRSRHVSSSCEYYLAEAWSSIALCECSMDLYEHKVTIRPKVTFTDLIHCMLPLKAYVDPYDCVLLQKSCEKSMHSFRSCNIDSMVLYGSDEIFVLLRAHPNPNPKYSTRGEKSCEHRCTDASTPKLTQTHENHLQG